MNDERDTGLLIRAIAAYKGVVANPRHFGPVAAGLVDAARQAGDAEALVVALRAQAWSERARLANDRAKPLLDEAVEVARRRRLAERLGEVLITRAAVSHELGRLAAAQRDLDRAATILPEGRSAELDLQQAALLQNIGRLAEAAAVYRRVLARPADAPAAVRAIMANNLALIEAHQGHHQAALDRLAEATGLATQVGPAVVALVAQSRAWVTVQAGRLTESLQMFDQAARLYETAGLSLGEHHLEYVDALLDLRLLTEATELAQHAVDQFERHGVLLMGAEARLRTAQLALLARDHPGAVAAATAAARSFRRQRRTAWEAQAAVLAVEGRVRAGEASPATLAEARRAAATLERLGIFSKAVEAHLAAGRVAVALGRAPAALDSLRRARELAARAPLLVRLKGRVAAALAAQVERRPGAVLRSCRSGLTDLRRYRNALPSIELRALASGHGVELGRLGLEVLLRTGAAARVLDWMELTRAAAMYAVEPPATEGIEEDLAALRAVQAELAQARSGTGGEPPELVARQAAIERRIRRASWERRPAAAVDGAVLTSSELRRLLTGQVLVEYGVLDGLLFAVVLEPRATRLVWLGPLEPVEDENEALLFSLRRLARPGSAAALAGARRSAELGLRHLRELLLAPLELPEDVRLVVVPSGALQRLPWSGLHPGLVSVAPSASFWARSRQRRAEADGRVVLVAGPDLPGAAAEVDALYRLHARPTVLAPPRSTVEAVVAALDGAALAHLACHGRLRSDNPTFSSLLLSDGSLTVHELDLRGIAPHRMVLAACDSAVDVCYEGDEMLGFVSALIARGTAGLVASSLAVPDLDAVPLMRALHELASAGATLAEALHGARATLDLDQPGAFVSWCAFTAFGAA